MKVVLTEQESRDYFFNALCNGLQYVLSGYDLSLNINDKEYETARQSIKDKKTNSVGISYEEVLIEVLVLGGSLTLVDLGCDGEYNSTITIKEVYERVSETPIEHLIDMIQENDDAVTADVIIQQVFFKEIIFG